MLSFLKPRDKRDVSRGVKPRGCSIAFKGRMLGSLGEVTKAHKKLQRIGKGNKDKPKRTISKLPSEGVGATEGIVGKSFIGMKFLCQAHLRGPRNIQGGFCMETMHTFELPT
ncbi:hypothetical protein JCGZ_20011 [Jatropha curcas]|uniref:Uncharacterized protein n=1 Tax=Jatropha curcas TaxID=180498 RepID=A0A067JU28_JATCU|nr:hypothetical protein JCGZ_20011 [Jatropha curcas]